MTTMPNGTVTFLFTDIVEGAQLWEQHPAAMAQAVAQQEHLLRQAVAAHAGVVFNVVDDGIHAAFARAGDALAGALAGQRALAAAAWPAPLGSLPVRMALQSGAVEARDGDYFGPPLNRAARLLAAGHGGQVLLGNSTAGLARHELPPDVILRDLGERRLKDIPQPEHIFQLLAPDLPDTFPPLDTLDRRPLHLPAQPTPLVGRTAEARAVATLLRAPETRLVTLSGPGGTGKTRLSQRVAADLVDEFHGGVWFVDLSAISDPTLVVPAIALVFDVRETSGQPLHLSLLQYLQDKQLLLVLDNFEQVTAAAPLVGDLLAGAPDVRVLATSRILLRLPGEQEYPVPPLPVPDIGHLPPVERLTEYAAVRLFIERARAVRPDFTVTNETAPAVAAICARLDGLPLAIELAAARVRILAPDALLRRLESRLGTLTGGARDLPARQQTLRGAIDWSYDLLAADEQRLFRRLAVFQGGWTAEAAAAVCSADGALALDMAAGLTSLSDKSLLRQEVGPEGEPQFLMLETIHEYARERLVAGGEDAILRHAHAAYFLALVERAEPELNGPDQAAWLARLDMAHDNIRAALHWTLEAAGDRIGGMRLAAALWRFWWVRGPLSEGRYWLEGALIYAHTADLAAADLRARVFSVAGSLAWAQGDYPTARDFHTESLALSRIGDDKAGIAFTLNNLGVLAAELGDPAQAQAFYGQSAALQREIGDLQGLAQSLNNMGVMAQDQENYDQAQDFYEQSLALSEQTGDQWVLAMALNNLGEIALDQGDPQQARILTVKALLAQQSLGDRWGIITGLEVLAAVYGALGYPLVAARLFGATALLRTALGSPLSPPNQARYDRRVAQARRQIAEAAWEEAWAAGQTLTLEEAIAEALREP